jgi:hypothetical protein
MNLKRQVCRLYPVVSGESPDEGIQEERLNEREKVLPIVTASPVEGIGCVGVKV